MIGHDYEPPEDWQLDPDRAWSTWRPIDIRPVLDGIWQPPLPTVGRRHDAPGLLYPGRRHDVYAESEAGKTWLGLRVVVDELADGHAAVFVDFEDDVGGIVGRLLAVDAPLAALRDRFAYLRPENPFTAPGEASVVAQVLGDLRPTVVVLDGRTEAMGLHGAKVIDNDDVARYSRTVERPFTDAGAAVLALDHVTKDRETRGRYGMGGAHKLNGLNGAAFTLHTRRPFGHGVTGRSTLRISKDRPGQLRRHGLPGRDGAVWLADLVVDAEHDWPVDVTLRRPIPAAERDGFRPTEVMAKVVRLLEQTPGLSKRAVRTAVGGKADVADLARELLAAEGYVSVRNGPRGAREHYAERPFTT